MSILNEPQEIGRLQSEVVSLKEAFVYLTSCKFKNACQKRLEALSQFQYEIECLDLPELSRDFPLITIEDYNNALKRMKKTIKLLQILLLKVDCPISKIVDNI